MHTVGDWVERPEPRPPAALHDRLRAALAPSAAEPISRLPGACLEAAESMLEGLIDADSASRDTALDLLAVDALMTYAFEHATEAPADYEAFAAAAMQRISAFRQDVSPSA